EERIIAASLDQAELDDANERGAGGADGGQAGRSCKGDDHHFARVGRAGQGARLTTGELFAEAVRLALRGAIDLSRLHPPRWHRRICVMLSANPAMTAGLCPGVGRYCTGPCPWPARDGISLAAGPSLNRRCSFLSTFMLTARTRVFSMASLNSVI